MRPRSVRVLPRPQFVPMISVIHSSLQNPVATRYPTVGYHRRELIWSTFTELRLRYSLNMIAMASANSAAATVMTNTINTCPSARLRLTKVDECRVSDQVDVDGIQHELDGHEDQDGAPAREHAVQAYREQSSRKNLEMCEFDQSRSPVVLTSTIEPINATSSTSEATSNGTAQSVNRLSPNSRKPTLVLSTTLDARSNYGCRQKSKHT